MSDQTSQPAQSTPTSGELRQRMLEQLDASKQAIEELNDEELENVAGGGLAGLITKAATKFEQKGGWKYMGSAALSATSVQISDSLKQHNSKQGK